MGKWLGFLSSVTAMGLLLYGHPGGVDLVVVYAWICVVLSVVAIPILILVDSSVTFKTKAEARTANSKPRMVWSVIRLVLIGGGLGFHGAVVTASFFLICNGLLVLIMRVAAEARLNGK